MAHAGSEMGLLNFTQRYYFFQNFKLQLSQVGLKKIMDEEASAWKQEITCLSDTKK